ncbi:MAG: ThuA domain-containing protein, partial [Candidatus Latescibacteria bacterium]|jgi:type 1 glutamine amidotransferase|nr:ThuA domain-containing protein [Candidatus Latescibacterota bacterium]
MRISVEDANHPITQGISDWEMIDETYLMAEPDAESHLLLTTDHPENMKSIGWTRQYNDTRVFCFQSGHDNQTWVDENFQTVLTRGIQWAAGRI